MKNVRNIKELQLPVQTMIARDLVSKYSHLAVIPLQDYNDAVPRLIIGMRNCNLGLALEYREGKADEPRATRTHLGSVIHGVKEQANRSETIFPSYHIRECAENNRLDGKMNSSTTDRFVIAKIEHKSKLIKHEGATIQTMSSMRSNLISSEC